MNQPMSLIGVPLDHNAAMTCDAMSWKVSADSERAAKEKGPSIQEANAKRETSSLRRDFSRNASKSACSARTDAQGTGLLR